MAKFKVGDKVRVVKQVTKDDFEGVKIGDIGEVVDFCVGSGYPIFLKINKHDEYGFEEEELELVKEEAKTEKTFKEVIRDIKEGEVWDSGNRKISMNKYKQIFIDGSSNLRCFDPSVKYKLQRKEYTFQEAFKAYEEGREIESVCSRIKYKKYDKDVSMFKMEGKEEFSGINNDNAIFSINEIRGKWCIND